jgi:hypothetical protein
MEAMAREWTDDRMDKRFEKLDADLREVRGEMREMRRTMTQGFLGLGGIMVTGFIGLFTLIVAQV